MGQDFLLTRLSHKKTKGVNKKTIALLKNDRYKQWTKRQKSDKIMNNKRQFI